MAEPDFPALLRRLEEVSETETALARIEIMDRIGDALPEGSSAAISEIRDVLHWLTRAHCP